MTARPGNRWRHIEWPLALISFVVLLACLFYTFAYTHLTPYPGMDFNSGWVVIRLDPCDVHPGWCEANQGGLRIGDRLMVIGDLSYEDTWDDRRRVPFDGYGPGESVPITLRRDGHDQTIDWQMPDITGSNRLERLAGLLFYLPFWLAGTVVLLLLRPRDRRWQLLVACSYVTAFWLATGMVSYSGEAASSLVLHAVTWLLVPIYLHLHLLVPRPLLRRRLRYHPLALLYAVALVLAALELLQLLPNSAYVLGLFVAMSGSLGMLLFHSFHKSSRSVRRAARLMLAGIGLALGPSFVLGIVPKLLDPSAPGLVEVGVAILATPLLPLLYAYVIFKRHLGAMEFRANRVLSLYSFTLLYLTVAALVFVAGWRWTTSPSAFVVFAVAVSTVFVVASPALQTQFQRLVDKLTYGTKHNPDDILLIPASKIPAALDRQALVQLLADEVAPSFLIRQSALVCWDDAEIDLVYARGASLEQTRETLQQVQALLAEAGRYRSPLAEGAEMQSRLPHESDWVRLAIALETRNRTIGVWLFGRRDPDDYYPQPDIVLLAALGSQVAVALENIRLYEQVRVGRNRLQVLARQLVVAQEEERRRLSRALHDEAGQRLTALRITLELIGGDLPAEFGSLRQRLGDAANLTSGIMEQIRLLAQDLRPPALDAVGLNLTLEGFCRDYSRRTRLSIDYQSTDGQVPAEPICICLYRFLQEALTNVVKHAGAGQVRVALQHDTDEISLSVEDNGHGFDVPSTLPAQSQPMGIGLLGMQERIESLGGWLEIESQPGQGTRLVAHVPMLEA